MVTAHTNSRAVLTGEAETNEVKNRSGEATSKEIREPRKHAYPPPRGHLDFDSVVTAHTNLRAGATGDSETGKVNNRQTYEEDTCGE